MRGIRFQIRPPLAVPHPNRADIACFTGFVRRRARSPLTPELARWFQAQGWSEGPYRRDLDTLLDVPAPVDTWDTFDRLYDWERRDPSGGTLMGAAVRSFFAQGGRKCYVVRSGDPWDLRTSREFRMAALGRLIPGHPGALDAAPGDRRSWHGVAHLFGLPEVSFLCVPDLADAVALDRGMVAVDPPSPPSSPEVFVTCPPAQTAAPLDVPAQPFAAPRCDQAAYGEWVRAVRAIGEFLRRWRREVQFVAALPLPHESANLRAAVELAAGDEFVQLAYPWVRTPGAANLPEMVESPDGVLAGVLARNAMTRGAFATAAGLHLGDLYDTLPRLNRHEEDQLQDGVSIFGRTPQGWRLLSDVTASANSAYRPASANRLVSLLVRAARVLGEDMTFEPSGERLWARIRNRMSALMLGLYQAGALDGATAKEAFQVRCDRSTMSQNDIDNARVVVEIQFTPTFAIESITVVLAMSEGGQASLVSTTAREAAA